MEDEKKLAALLEPALDPGEHLLAATNADHRDAGNQVVGFVFSGLVSNLVEKATGSRNSQGEDTDDEVHLPFGPVVVAVTDQRILFFSRGDVNPTLGPPELVTALPPEAIRRIRHGHDPLTDTLVVEFADEAKLVLTLDTFNHSHAVIKAVKTIAGPYLATGADEDDPDPEPAEG